MKPRVLLPLLVMFWMCLSHVKLSVIVTPRKLLASSVSSICPCSLYSDCSIFLFFGAIRRTTHLEG